MSCNDVALACGGYAPWYYAVSGSISMTTSVLCDSERHHRTTVDRWGAMSTRGGSLVIAMSETSRSIRNEALRGGRSDTLLWFRSGNKDLPLALEKSRPPVVVSAGPRVLPYLGLGASVRLLFVCLPQARHPDRQRHWGFPTCWTGVWVATKV